MGVAHGCFGVGVAEEALDFVEGSALVDEEACKGVSQVMEADVGEAGVLADGVPGGEDGDGDLPVLGVMKTHGSRGNAPPETHSQRRGAEIFRPVFTDANRETAGREGVNIP